MSIRQQPYSIAAEASTLGAIFLRPEVFDLVASLVGAEDFYQPAHQEIFRALEALAHRSAKIDPVTVETELTGCGTLAVAGGIVYIGELVAGVPTAENVETYARIVRDLSTARMLIQKAGEIGERAYSERDVVDLIARAGQEITALAARSLRRGFRQARPVIRETFAAMGARGEKGSLLPGVPTGYPDLDQLTCGLQPAESTILAARPSVGKTALAVNIALRAVLDHKIPVLFFSLEMSETALAERMLCCEGRVESTRARLGKLLRDEWERIVGAASKITEAPLYLDDDGTVTIEDIRARARHWRRRRDIFPPEVERPLGLVIVDYLQLVVPINRREPREQQVAQVSGGLKGLAKEIQLPVLALAQLNRSVEERTGAPRLSDLRESGAVEQDADVVAFLHRDPKDDPSVVKLILAKQRNGPTGSLDLVFLRDYTRFESVARNADFTDPPTTHFTDTD